MSQKRTCMVHRLIGCIYLLCLWLFQGGCGDSPTTPRPLSDGWIWQSVRPANLQVTDVWQFAPDDLLAIGRQGLIANWDGTSWRFTDLGLTGDLNAVWASSPTDIYVVGDDGIILHFDGSLWHREDSGSLPSLRDVGGTDPSRVFAVGDDGVVLRRRDPFWELLPGSFGHSLSTLWCGEDGTVMAGGSEGRLVSIVRDSVHTAPASNNLDNVTIEDLAGIDGSHLVAIMSQFRWFTGDPTLVTYDGKQWHPTGLAPGPLSRLTREGNRILFWGRGRNGDDACLLSYALDRDQFNRLPLPKQPTILVRPISDGRMVALAGDGRLTLVDDSTVQELLPGAFPDVRLISGTEEDLWVVGQDARAILHRYQSGHWERWDLPGPARRIIITQLWCPAPGELYAVGSCNYHGCLYHCRNGAWEILANFEHPHTLFHLWGSSAQDIYMCSWNRVFHWDGCSVNEITHNEESGIIAGIWGRGPRDVFVLRGGGVVQHFDGSTWQEWNLSTSGLWTGYWTDDLNRLHILGPRSEDHYVFIDALWRQAPLEPDLHLTILGQGGGLVHALDSRGRLWVSGDGIAWDRLPVLPPLPAEQCTWWVAPDGSLLVGGPLGSVLRLGP